MALRDKLKIELTAENRTRAAFAQLKRDLGGLKRQASGVRSALSGMFAGFSAGLALKGIIDANVEMQKLQATLATFTGGKAPQIFRLIQQYATTTPESLGQVTQAFNRLISAGLTPTFRTLRAFGNIAAGVGKRTIDFVEAVADATMGEFERLKEFGVKASKQGDMVAFTFQGVTTQVRNSARDIEAYLRKLGETQFAGALDRQSQTLAGAFSNLRDAFTRFAQAVGEAGLNTALSETAGRITALVSGSGSLAQSLGGALSGAVRAAGAAFEFMARSMVFVHDNGRQLIGMFAALLAMGVARRVVGMAIAFVKLAKAVRTASVISAAFTSLSRLSSVTWLALAGAIAYAAGALDKFKAGVGAVVKAVQGLLPTVRENLKTALETFGFKLTAFESELKNAAVPAVADLDNKLKGLLPTISKTGSATGALAEKKVKLKNALTTIKQPVATAKNAFESLRDSIANTLSDAITAVVTGTKKIVDAFRALARSIISTAIRVLVNAAVRKLLSLFVGGLFGGGGGLFVGTGGLFAKGGVFAGGRELTVFARGGVVTRPTVFPMAGGAGLMGEAGPEAIMPLKRGPDGKLGVVARGARPVNLSVNIDARGATPDAVMKLKGELPRIIHQTVGEMFQRDPRYAGAF